MANGLFGGIIWASQQATGGGIRGTVNTFNDLPAAADHPEEMWVVLSASRVPILNWHSEGLYYSNGATWDYKGASPELVYTDVFRLIDPLENNKQLAFDLSTQSTVTRTITSPDRDLNLNTPIFDSVTFNPSAPMPTQAEGKMFWNATYGTVEVGMPGGNVNLQIGQETLIRARNVEGATIINGQAVRISSAASAVPQVVLVNNLEEASDSTIAVATEDVNNNNQGYFTTEGLVRGMNTAGLTEGAVVWLGSTDGALTTTTPTAPSQFIKIGYCIRQHATEGVLYVSVDAKEIFRDRAITREPTGFAVPPVLNYNSTTRTITLSGTVQAYYQGQRLTQLVSGWVSPAHPATDGLWFLYYDGTNFIWSTTPWELSTLQVAAVRWSTTGKFALTEAHGFMPWPVHQELHRTIGTYLVSGGDTGGFVLGSTTVANRRPTISSTEIADEDNPSTLATLNNGLYTQRYLAGSGASITYNVDATDIIPLSGSTPFYNQFTGGAWQQTLFPTNAYGAVFIMAVPVTADAGSQKFRYMFIQPQTVSTTLSDIQNLTPASLNMGESAGVVSEYVFIGKIIVRFTAGNWVLTSVEKLTGNRFIQTSSQQGSFLSAVSTDSTLVGSGTAGSPLRMSGIFTPQADSATAFQIRKADGVTPLFNVDTTNSSIRIGSQENSGVTPPLEVQASNAQLFVTSTSAFDATSGGSVAFRGKFTSTGNFGTFGSIGVYKENTSSGDLRSYMTLDVRNNTDGLFDAIKITSNGFVGLKGVTDPQNFLHIKSRYNAGSAFNGAIRIENWTNNTFGMIDHIIGGLAIRNNGYYNQSGTVTPKATSYTQVTMGAGVIDFLVNTGLVVDTPFEPTIRMSIDTVGAVIGSATSTNSQVYLHTDTIARQAGYNWRVNNTLRNALFMDTQGTLGRIRFGRYTSSGVFVDSPFQMFNDTGNLILCETTGNVLIGTSTDKGFKLDTIGSVRGTEGLFSLKAMAYNSVWSQQVQMGVESDQTVNSGFAYRWAWRAQADNATNVYMRLVATKRTDGDFEVSRYDNSGNAWFVNNVSALSFTDRTPYPKDLQTAIDSVMSMERLPEGEYDEDNKEWQLDHSKLHPYLKSGEESRDMSATISCQNEVIKYLLSKIDILEQRINSLVNQ